MGWEVNPSLGIITGGVPLATGRFYDSRFSASTTTLAISANVLYASPFYVPKTKTFTSINIEVTTLAAASSIRLGIYSDTNGVPNALLLDAGTVSSASTGGKTIAISQSLPAGWYWLVGVGNGTPTLRALVATSSVPQLGFTSGTDVTTHIGWSVAFAYAALPNPFTAGGALMTTAVPRFMLGL